MCVVRMDVVLYIFILFSLNENPVTVCLTGAILLLYVLLMILCHKLDTHDARKGGITYLIDNNLTDKQKYEVTIETGFRKGAGTTAKVKTMSYLSWCLAS